MLIESLAAEFEPAKYSDTYRTNLQAMIQAKVEGRAVVETPEAKGAEVINIMDALERSLERKPAATATVEHGEVPKRKKRA
jgi:DNA end-binding protein Ku